MKCITYSLKFGFVIFQNGSSKIGNLVYHSCLPGYVLVGNTTHKCMDDGNWSGTKPKCEGMYTLNVSNIMRLARGEPVCV